MLINTQYKYMATLLSTYTEIGFTILPHMLNTELQQDLIKYPGNYVIGYVTYNKENCEYKFINTNSSTESNTHWSLNIIKKLPYCENIDTWIVFNCPPHKTKVVFQNILLGDKIQIEHWDTWSVEGADAKVAVITSWEIA
jgi:hypothetical protein